MKRNLLGGLAALVLASTVAFSQTAAAPPAGTVDAIVGQVSINQQPVEQGNQMVTLRDGDVLEIATGHAEILLTPGVFLRLGNGAALEMLQASQNDVRMSLHQGAAIIEANDVNPANHIGLEVGQGVVEVLKPGLYRFDASRPSAQVIQGEAAAMDENQTVQLHPQDVAVLDGSFRITRGGEVNDELAAWSRSRSQTEAEASVASAQYEYDNGSAVPSSSWVWNPWVSTYTWIPGGGPYVNFYGYSYWSPAFVYRSYPRRFYGAWRPAPIFITRPGFRQGYPHQVWNRPGRSSVWNRPGQVWNRPPMLHQNPIDRPLPSQRPSREFHNRGAGAGRSPQGHNLQRHR